MLGRVRMPYLSLQQTWPGLLSNLENFTPTLKWSKVLWEFPPKGWVKYNTDGASRGNPGLSSYAFCLIDEKGDLLYAEGDTIDNFSNTVAEAKAILEASKHCKRAYYNSHHSN